MVKIILDNKGIRTHKYDVTESKTRYILNLEARTMHVPKDKVGVIECSGLLEFPSIKTYVLEDQLDDMIIKMKERYVLELESCIQYHNKMISDLISVNYLILKAKE